MIQSFLDNPLQVSLAEQKLNGILKKFPESPRIYLYFGEFYNRCGKHEKAIEMFKSGIGKNPDDALLYWNIAIAYQGKSEIKFAIQSLHKALELGLERSLERYAKALLKILEQKT